MGGKLCLRGMRVTVGTIVELVASGRTQSDILDLYPYLEAEDVRQALEYASWRSEEIDVRIPNRWIDRRIISCGGNYIDDESKYSRYDYREWSP